MMNRRTAAQIACLLCLSAAPLFAAAGKPNIVLILSDDQSVPFAGCYGDPTVKTPNLDRFAAEGMKFDHNFQAAPQCVLARAGMLTGRSPVGARISRFSSPLPPDVVTLPELLRSQQGYFTGICRRNFHLDGSGKGNLQKLYDKLGLQTFDQRVDYLDRNSPASQTVAKVNEFLDKVPGGKPFFLWVSFNDPHHPWDEDAIPHPYDPSKIVPPAYLPNLPGVRSSLARYYGEITRMDGEFQSVLDILSKRGLSENTLVVFLGDNGYAFPHGKGTLYDPGLNCPLILRWPGHIQAGSASSELVSGEDLTPTLLDAAGVAPAKEMTGRSYLGLLVGGKYEPRKHIFGERGVHGSLSTLTTETKSSVYDYSRCVRSKQHKLIYNCTPNIEYWPVDCGNDPVWKDIVAAHEAGKLEPKFDKAYFGRPRPIFELYDLEKDPTELNNLAGSKGFAKVERELKEALQEKMVVDYDYLPLPLAD